MKIAYKDAIVAFIDVLGFSSLVYSNSTTPIQRFFDYVIDEFREDAKTFRFTYLLISDTIVIHTENNQANLEHLIISLGKLQMKLITRGILVRGGVSFGDLFTDPSTNVIVGSGLINAYHLEGKAVYPRIIIDRQLVGATYGSTDELMKANHGRLTLVPPLPYHRDFPYINFTRKLAIVMQKPKLAEVVKLIRDNFFRNEHVDKYMWLLSHIFQSLEEQFDFLEHRTGVTTRQAARDRLRLRVLREFRVQLESIVGNQFE